MMRNVNEIVCIMALIVFGSGSDVLAEWEFQESGVTETLNDVCFVDELQGWAVGDNSTIIATTDGGDTWVRQECPDENFTLNGVEFVNEKVGFCIGHMGTSQNPIYKNIILYTQDSGETWVTRTPDDDTILNYKDLAIVDEKTCWVTAGIKGLHGKILYTADAGITWETKYTSENISPNQYLFYGIDFINKDTGWALGGIYQDVYNDTYLYGTVNGGDDWSEIGHVSYLSQNRLYALNRDVIWTCNNLVHVSTNGGTSWSLKDQRYQDSIRDIYPLDDQKAFVLMRYSLNYTEDGGQTMETVVTDSTSHFCSMAGIDSKYVWCIKFNGTIFKYTVEQTSVEDTSLLPRELRIMATPNPFNSSTTINFTIAHPGTVSLAVYSVSGQKVVTLVDGFIPAGTHAAVFDGSSLASGLYLYRFEAKGFAKTGKIVLVK